LTQKVPVEKKSVLDFFSKNKEEKAEARKEEKS